MYGAQRPYLSKTNYSGLLEYDRPTHPCDVLLLWTLPPSWTHLKWLLALARPSQVYVRNHCPQLPDAITLRSDLNYEIAKYPERPPQSTGPWTAMVGCPQHNYCRASGNWIFLP